MRQALVMGNWKMHGNRAEVAELLQNIVASVENVKGVDVAVCPPLLYVSQARELLEASSVGLGAQNLCAESSETGAYTGEVSAQMLSDQGCQYVLVGHSERREYYADDDCRVAEKIKNAVQHALQPVFCVGESLQQREAGETLGFVAQQLAAVIDRLGISALKTAVIAYEPIWAIGTGLTATPDQAQEVHRFIRETLAEYDEKLANSMRLLYGGSVKPNNAAELFAQPDIDGALVGGASLKSDDFVAIVNAAKRNG